MTSRIYVMNNTTGAVTVEIVAPDGSPDSINVVPGGRPYLQAGYIVNPIWRMNHPEIKVEEVSLDNPA